MNRNIFNRIIAICMVEINESQMKLDTENLKPFDQQYQIGRKHAATDIAKKIEELKRETQI